MQLTIRLQEDTAKIVHIVVGVLRIEETPSQFVRTAIREYAKNHKIEVKNE